MSEDLVDAPDVAVARDATDPRDGSAPLDTAATDDMGAWDRWRERRRTRVSRWDRPPPPKDWRYFVGTLGKILITTGLLMFGFVAYQLWGTGIETARAQNQLEDTFEQRLEANAAVDDAPGTDTEAGPVDTVVDASDVDEPAEPAEPADVDDEPAAAPGVGSSEVVPGGIDVSEDAVDQNVPVVPGEAFAKIDIARIGIDDLYIIPGVQLDDLKKGPGHYPSTPLPGQLGNASLAGHRTTYGAPFFDLDQLAPGDEIIVTMVTGDQFVYRVTGSQVVTAADSWVITTRDPNVAELTLTTCDPKYTARNRLVVHSVLVPERSSQVGVAEFYDLDEPEPEPESEAVADGPEEIAGDDPTVTAPATGGDPVDESGDEAPTGSGDTSSISEPDATVAAPDDASGAVDEAVDDGSDDGATEVAAAADDAEIDAFSEGWFHDPAAWPQIALWAGVLALISVLAYQLAKKTRHSSVGVLVGIVPFVVALYFFYQNVNRLLPPGL